MSITEACMTELEGRDADEQVTVYLLPVGMSGSHQRTMVWGDVASVRRVSSDGLTAALVVAEDDGRVQIIPESRIERVEIGGES